MPLDVHLALISIVDDKELIFDEIETDDVTWHQPPPKSLSAFQFERCHCEGPSSGFKVKLKYGPLIAHLDVTSWGIKCLKSTPTKNGIEFTSLSDTHPYRYEILFL